MPHTHPDADAFIRRIVADPRDPVIRQVFADWLDDQGGAANETWARYIRLRTDAATGGGTDRDLLHDDAANVAPHVRARLTLSAPKFAPRFAEFVDLLPPERLTVHLDDFDLPTEPNDAVGGVICREFRVLVVTHRDGLYALVTDLPSVGVLTYLHRRLPGRYLFFHADTADLDRALDRHFRRRPAIKGDEDGGEVEPAAPSARERCATLIEEARGEGATGIEVMAYPDTFQVRYVVGGRATQRHVVPLADGQRLVGQFLKLADAPGSGIRCRPRNTSFGDGVMVELLRPAD